MKKVLFVTTRLIYPVNDGRKVVLYNYCKGLAEQHNCEIKLFSIIDEEEKNIKQPSFISEVYQMSPPSKAEKLNNLIINSMILNRWPLQVSLYFSKKIKAKLDKVIEQYNPDIVICDMARTAEYLKDLDDKKYNKILDMDDILSKRYKRQYENGSLSSDALGAYSKKLPDFINKILDKIDIMKFILKKEYKLLSKYEIEISKYYKSIVFVSPIEARAFNKEINEDKGIDITIGVDYEYFSQKIARRENEKTIAFLGNMYVAHNKDAVKSFLDNIFPLILEDIPDAKLRIIGRCTSEYKKQMSKYANVELTGEVDDVRPYVQECSVAIAPLTYGSGIKTKILETMAMGIPVITNSIGAEGISVENYKEIIIEDGNTEYANAVIQLITNENLRNNIINNAQVFINEHHLWKKILLKFESIL